MTFGRILLPASLMLGLSMCAHAQVGVYGTISTERLSGVDCKISTLQTTPTPCSSNDRVDRGLGAGGGVYYNFMTLGPARIGADVRANILKSNKSASTAYAGTNAFRMDEALGGVRASFKIGKGFYNPFVEGALGWNRRDRVDNFLAYRFFAGLDIALLPVMDVRLPEVGVGQNIGRNGVSSNTVESVTVGVVFHMPRRN